jgi:hypothetical protein
MLMQLKQSIRLPMNPPPSRKERHCDI